MSSLSCVLSYVGGFVPLSFGKVSAGGHSATIFPGCSHVGGTATMFLWDLGRRIMP